VALWPTHTESVHSRLVLARRRHGNNGVRLGGGAAAAASSSSGRLCAAAVDSGTSCAPVRSARGKREGERRWQLTIGGVAVTSRAPTRNGLDGKLDDERLGLR
jgi:hypothetical protein